MKKISAIIIHSVSRWDQPLSSASLSLAKEFSNHHLTFYVDHPFSLKDLFKNFFSPQIQRRLKALLFGKSIYYQLDKSNNKLFAVTPLITLPINWLPQGKLYNMLLAFNNKIFEICLNRIIKDFNLSDYIYFNSYNPFYGHPLKLKKAPLLYIYQTRDNIEESAYVNRHGVNLERKAAVYADICLATSKELTAKLNKTAPTIFFPNAANVNLFKQSLLFNGESDAEIKKIKKIQRTSKVIGYFGHIGFRVDFDLLKKIIEAFPNDLILLIGPYDYRNYTSVNFHNYKNVIFTGSKPLHELPKYLSVMNCAILPFLKNDLTKSIYPLKINEYLAGGKPVVTTNFSEDLEDFTELIYIANDHHAFIKGIKDMLTESDPILIEKRIKKAEENSWAERIKYFWEIVDEKIKIIRNQ